MATGDIKNNLKKLQKQISLTRYPDQIDYDGLTKGVVNAHLPLLYHAFFHFSPQVVENTSKLNYNIAGKKDIAFINVVYRIMRDMDPSCIITLKVGQFMSKGFAERKIIFTASVLKFVRTSPKLIGSKSGCKTVTKHELNGNGVATPTRPRTQPAGLRLGGNDSTPTRPRVHSAMSSMLSTMPQMHSTGRSVLGASAAPVVSNDLSQVESLHSGAQCDLGATTPTRDDPIGREDQDDLYVLLMGVSDEVTKLKEVIDSENKGRKEFEEKMERRLVMLETENLNLKTRVGSLETEREALEKEISELKSIQQPQVDLNNIVARLDLYDMKFQTLEGSRTSTPRSPVCGDDLCSHMKKLNLPQNDTVADESQTAVDVSLLDATNSDSPYRQQIRQKGVKLLELVQGTRSLLGMSDDLEKFKLAGTEESQNVNEEAENQPPIKEV